MLHYQNMTEHTTVTLRFQVQRDGSDFKVRRFKTKEEDVYYKLPSNLQSKNLHPKLFTHPLIAKAESDCAKDQNYRHLSIKMAAADASSYIDELGNPIAYREIRF